MTARKPHRPLECSLGSYIGPTSPILGVRATPSPYRHKGRGRRYHLLREECPVTRVVEQSATATSERQICHPHFRAAQQEVPLDVTSPSALVTVIHSFAHSCVTQRQPQPHRFLTAWQNCLLPTAQWLWEAQASPISVITPFFPAESELAVQMSP